jgi:hypothetical protein
LNLQALINGHSDSRNNLNLFLSPLDSESFLIAETNDIEHSAARNFLLGQMKIKEKNITFTNDGQEAHDFILKNLEAHLSQI